MYRDHREGPGGPPSGATSPRRLRGPSVGGDQPQVGWCAPHQGPRRMGEWEGANPRSRWALRPTLVAPPSSPWPHPPRRLDLLGPVPPPLALLYIVGRWRTSYLDLWCLPLPLQHLLLLHSAWRSPAGVLQLHHHHAVVLLLEPSSSTSPSPLLDQEEGDVTLTVRVLNAEVPSVRR